MYIIGINAFHGDSSACILKNGYLIAAAEEERFKRIKHYAGFPYEAIKYCLEEAKISINDIDHIAVNTNPKANYFKKVLYVLCTKQTESQNLEDLYAKPQFQLNLGLDIIGNKFFKPQV